MTRRDMLLSFVVISLSIDVAMAQSAIPSPLLAIDQHRSTVIERIVAQWGVPLAQSSAGLDAEQLRTLLAGLRADQLLAASLAGTLDGLRDVVAGALTPAAAAPVRDGLLRTKALGDANDDLVYTPINPCRIVDTRLGAGGFLGNGVARDWNVSRPAGNFSDQGGASTDCGIPAAPAAVLANLAVTGSSQPGVLFASAFNQPPPTASTLNYAGGETIANAVIVPLAIGQSKELHIFVSTATHVVVDVMGYFKAPVGNAGQYFKQGGNAFGAIAKFGTLDNRIVDLYANDQPAARFMPTALNAPNVALGFSVNGLGSGVVGAIVGGGAPGGQNAVVPGTSTGSLCARVFGCLNAVTDSYGTVAGGVGNLAGDGESFGLAFDNAFATVGGGLNNWASSRYSAIGGGENNIASGSGSAIGGGRSNEASGENSTIAGGDTSVAAGSNAVVPGGKLNHARGDLSFAAGYLATIPASAPGSFLWSDSTGPATLPEGASNQFIVASTGGIGMYTSKTFTTGCSLTGAATMWVCTSDRNVKENFVELNAPDVLRRLAAMSIPRWNEKGVPGVQHVGPTAQDFHAAFGLGADDRHIGSGDLSGVALVAIQGLNAKVQDQQREIAELRRAIDALIARTSTEGSVAQVR